MKNQDTEAEILGALALTFKPGVGFMVRDVVDACEWSPVLRAVLARTQMMNANKLGHVLGRLEGHSFAGMKLWREWSSRKGHRYSLRPVA